MAGRTDAETVVRRGCPVVPHVRGLLLIEGPPIRKPIELRGDRDRSSVHPQDSLCPSDVQEILVSLQKLASGDDSNVHGIFLRRPISASPGGSDESGGEPARRTPRLPVEPASEGPHLLSPTAKSSRRPKRPWHPFPDCQTRTDDSSGRPS